MNLEELYKSHYSDIYRFAYQLSQSVDIAQDLVQEAFLKLGSQGRRKNDEIRNIRSWLFRVVYNNFITLKKKEENHRRIESGLAYYETSATIPGEDYELEERKRIIRDELKKLSEFESSILILYGNGESYADISEILKINKSSVGSYILRARKKLASELKASYHEMFK